MRVRYWRGGELEREEVVEAGPRVCAELPKVLVRPFQVLGATRVFVEGPTLAGDEYALVGAMEHSKAGVLCAEYVWRGYRLAQGGEAVGRG